MELFFVLLGLVLLTFPIIAIAALVKSVGLGEHLRRLEVRLAGARTRHGCADDGRGRARAAARSPRHRTYRAESPWAALD
jgi:hypothetical protein